MHTRRLLGVAAVACLAIALGCFAMAWRSGEPRHLVSFAAGDPASSRSTGLSDAPPGASTVLRSSAPVGLKVPAIGLSTRVVPVGLTKTGHMELPDPSVAGWYRLGAAPGVQGPTVLVGHVDSHRGPAVFYRLSGTRSGETVWLVRADGSRIRFLITKVSVSSKAHFPSRAVFDRTARSTIRLITCTGPFNPDTGYVDSLIVWGHATPP